VTNQGCHDDEFEARLSTWKVMVLRRLDELDAKFDGLAEDLDNGRVMARVRGRADHPAPTGGTMNNEESYLELLGTLRDLARSEHLSAEDRLVAIDQTILLARGGPTEEATEWAHQVVLGLVTPIGDDEDIE
jgi:hypothetical protein